MLLQESQEIQVFLRDVTDKIYKSTKPSISNKLNKTYIQLIYNLYNKTPPKAKYITGPFSLTKHSSKKYDKQIYIFGESHGNEEQCDEKVTDLYNISDYLKEIFDTSPVFIDFYLEYKMFPKYYHADKYIDNSQLMYYIWKLVDDCMDPEGRKSKCPWNNIRSHFVDRRDYKGTKSSQIGKLVQAARHMKDYTDIFKVLYDTMNELDLIASFKDDINKITDYAYNLAINIDIRKNERLDIPIEVLGPIFKKYIKKLFEIEISPTLSFDIEQLFLRRNTGYRKMDFLENPKTKTIFINIMKSLLVINSVILDFYLLKRIFKTFRDTGLNQPKITRNNIVYTGDSHSIMLRNVLNDLGFTQDETAKYSGKQRCLYMNGINQPLFY